jgi:dolichol-phosphate mannosyltransferase
MDPSNRSDEPSRFRLAAISGAGTIDIEATGRLDVFVSVVAALSNYGDWVKPFLAELLDVLQQQFANFEVVLVDDGSIDERAARQIAEVIAEFRCVRLVRLSRAMGTEIAMMAGFDSAIGDFVVTLNPETDPPQAIAPMVDLCRSGHDIVVGTTPDAQYQGYLYRLLRHVFYLLSCWLIRAPLVQHASGFRVLSRQAVNALTRIKSRRRYFALLAYDIGYRVATVPYTPICRSGLRKPPSLLAAIRTGSAMIVHNSTRPLRIVSVLGLLGSFLSVLYAVYVVVVYLVKRDVMPGWATLSLQASGLFFLVFVMLTLMGEYMGRLLDEASDRPLYNILDETASSVMLTDERRRNVLSESATDVVPASPGE